MDKNLTDIFNTVKEVEEFRKQINEMCDARIDRITVCEKAKEASEKSFGYIKEAFESIAPQLYKLDEGRRILNKYIKTIQESKDLKTLHRFYENVRKAGKDVGVDSFVDAMVAESWNVNEIQKEVDVKKLGLVLAEGIMLINDKDINLPQENKTLDSAIEYIAENKMNSRKIVNYSKAKQILKEYISQKDDSNIVFEKVDLDALAKSLIKEFNTKYDGKLTKEEIEILQEIKTTDNIESVFEKYKNLCTDKINEARTSYQSKGDVETTDRLSSVLEQVNNKAFSPETAESDICGFIELSKIL